MPLNTPNQTAKDLVQIFEIVAQRRHELYERTEGNAVEVEALDRVAHAAQKALEVLRGAA